MSSIPGAHASLGFGRKRVEFYAAPGVTSGSSERRGEHEIRDMDGQPHTLRLSRPDTPLESGEHVTVLRMQSGPDHDSRPVAVVNHDRNAWTRTSPDATGVLGRSGVTRGLNWWMTMILFMVAALAFAWPDIRLFMLEVDPALFASLPDINVFAMAAGEVPALPGFDLAAAIPGFAGIAGQIGLPGWLTPNGLAFGLGLTVLALFTYFARSWRIIWAPAYVVAALVAGLALGSVSPLVPAILALGGIGLLFCLGGMINRTRDSARLENRIARLSENILANPPRESVSAPAATGAALAATAMADAAEDVPAQAAEAESDTEEAPAEAAEETVEAEIEEAAAEETPADPVDDDLPSDEELAAARAGTESPEEPDPAPVPSLRASNEQAADRDMIMPPPPPLANRAVSDHGDAGEAGEPEEAPSAEAEDTPAAEISEAPAVVASVTPSEVPAEPAPEASEPVIPAPALTPAAAETTAAEETPAPDMAEDAGDDEPDPFLSSAPASGSGNDDEPPRQADS